MDYFIAMRTITIGREDVKVYFTAFREYYSRFSEDYNGQPRIRLSFEQNDALVKPYDDLIRELDESSFGFEGWDIVRVFTSGVLLILTKS